MSLQQPNEDNTEARIGDIEIANEPAKEKTSEKASYFTDDTGTYKNGVKIANFGLTIEVIARMVDHGEIRQEKYGLVINFKGKVSCFNLPYEHLFSGFLMSAIHRVVGPEAYLDGPEKHLLLAIQKNISKQIPIINISLCTGFTQDYRHFLVPGMRITPEGMLCDEGPVVDLSDSNLAKKVNFQMLPPDQIKLLVQHMVDDFAVLKSPEVMLPVIGHVVLSPFSSWIVQVLCKQKYTLHLKGSSGGGKTFIADRVASFFGIFGDQLTSWSSTPNFIETEGYFFRDMVFVLDDYKSSIVNRRESIRVLQNYADMRGRSRLQSSSKQQRTHHIRGLLLSTGEDFVENVESVSGRTIILEVEPEHNHVAGEACMRMQNSYNGLIPRLVEWVISKEDWQESLKCSIIARIEDFNRSVNGISNGLRIATNWALNSAGFELFCKFAVHVDAIDDIRKEQLMMQYVGIVHDHLANETSALEEQSPDTLFFSVIGLLIATQIVVIAGLAGTQEISEEAVQAAPQAAKTIGKVSNEKSKVYIFPDLAIKFLVEYYARLKQPIPFTKNSLRTALVQNELIIKENDRYTKQVRHNGGRLQAWQFDLTEFKERCLDAVDE